ncbi:hypothetical protein X743_17770 [Mesorhizobium sp. LNHC252B00]|nr:hypothetical protein X743_17770 [Mesorhizobium sp. LNHC252B00]
MVSTEAFDRSASSGCVNPTKIRAAAMCRPVGFIRQADCDLEETADDEEPVVPAMSLSA